MNRTLLGIYNVVILSVYVWLYFSAIKVQATFQFRLWLIVFVYALFATFFSLLQFLNIENLLLKALLLELTQYLTMMSHWLFSWQYYTSSLDIEKMLLI